MLLTQVAARAAHAMRVGGRCRQYPRLCTMPVRSPLAAAHPSTPTATPYQCTLSIPHPPTHPPGTLDDGSVFDSSREREPLAFQIGAGRVIKGFDMAVTGLGVGETRKQRLQPADAYGGCVNENCKSCLGWDLHWAVIAV